jgi:D-amino peptidase
VKIYINTDIEGVAGWVFYAENSNTIFNYHHLERMNQLLTDEVNAAVKACYEAGATEVYVNDNHGPSYSICFEQLDPRCKIIHGRAGYAPAWLPCFDESFDAAIAIGMHAMAGTPGAVCPHSYWHVTDGNGKKLALSECTMFAAIAGEKGVPVVMISGDDKIAEEVREKIPSCEIAVVKEGLGAQNACSLIPARACELIGEKVKLGFSKLPRIKPYKIESPYKLNVSDRDPTIKVLDSDCAGERIEDLVHELSGKLYAKWGDQTIDDGSWRYPRNYIKS